MSSAATSYVSVHKKVKSKHLRFVESLQNKTSTNLRYYDLNFLWTVTEDIAAQDFYYSQIF